MRVPDDPRLRLRVRRQAPERHEPGLGIAEERERALLLGRLRLHQRERPLLLAEPLAQVGDRPHLLGELGPQASRLAGHLLEAHLVARAHPARAHHRADACGERHARRPAERLAYARAAGWASPMRSSSACRTRAGGASRRSAAARARASWYSTMARSHSVQPAARWAAKRLASSPSTAPRTCPATSSSSGSCAALMSATPPARAAAPCR